MMDRRSLQALTVFNKLECVDEKWRAPLSRFRGHVYYTWEPKEASTYFNAIELRRMHKHFGHPSAEKLYAIIKRAMGSPPPNTLAEIEAVNAACTACREYAPKSVAFRVREADRIVFNHRVILDLMWLPSRSQKKKRALLHVVDAGTRFNAARFLTDGQSSSAVWNTFIMCWSCMYVGMPHSLFVDQGSVFMSDEWASACEMNDIAMTCTGTESHNSLNVGETYHAYLRRVYCKLRKDFPKLKDEVLLSMSVNGPVGLVPSLLVFGIMPRFPNVARTENPDQASRLRAAAAARAEYEMIVTRERVKLAATKKTPSLVSSIRYNVGDLVYLYREKLKRYTGPHMIASIEGKHVRLHVGDSRGPRSFNLAQVRPAPLPNAFAEKLAEPRYPLQVLHTEVLKPGDHREAMFDDEKRKELLGLIDRGVFRLVLREEIPANANIVPSRFVLAIKHSEIGEQRLKARFVIGGHRDKDRRKLVHDSPTIRPESTRIIIALATILGLPLALADWTQGYEQSKSPLLRNVFTRPNELNLAPNELVQIIKPCYGLADAGDYWSETLRNHLRDNLQFKATDCDLSLWIRHVSDRLVAICGTYVDDVLMTGLPDAIDAFMKKSKEHFDVKFETSDIIRYVGIRIDSRNPELRIMSQPRQIERLQLLPADASFKQYRSARAALAWMLMTRPDVPCAISFAARVQPTSFCEADITAHNAVVRYLRRTKDTGLQFPKLDEDSLRIVTYIDASYSNERPERAQLGYIICLADRSNRCSIPGYALRKPRRVARSTSAAESLAFGIGFDNSFTLHFNLQRIIKRSLPLMMVTDSDIFFNIITRRKIPSERRIMVDLIAAREAYENRTIANIALVDSKFNPADPLTKLNGNDSLRKLLKGYTLDHSVKQFISEPALPAQKQPQASEESSCVSRASHSACFFASSRFASVRFSTDDTIHSDSLARHDTWRGSL